MDGFGRLIIVTTVTRCIYCVGLSWVPKERDRRCGDVLTIIFLMVPNLGLQRSGVHQVIQSLLPVIHIYASGT